MPVSLSEMREFYFASEFLCLLIVENDKLLVCRRIDIEFKALADEKVFSNPILFHGVITWNNGEIDIAPETVYRNSYAYECVV